MGSLLELGNANRVDGIGSSTRLLLYTFDVDFIKACCWGFTAYGSESSDKNIPLCYHLSIVCMITLFLRWKKRTTRRVEHLSVGSFLLKMTIDVGEIWSHVPRPRHAQLTSIEVP